MFVASEEATPGSVMAKQERISPARRGVNQVAWWRCTGRRGRKEARREMREGEGGAEERR